MKKLLLAGLILILGCTPVPTSAALMSAQTKGDGPGSSTGSSPSGTGNSAPSTTPTPDRSTREPSTGVPARAKPVNKTECERAGGKWQPTQNKCDLGA
jgi:hypothetical protein